MEVRSAQHCDFDDFIQLAEEKLRSNNRPLKREDIVRLDDSVRSGKAYLGFVNGKPVGYAIWDGYISGGGITLEDIFVRPGHEGRSKELAHLSKIDYLTD